MALSPETVTEINRRAQRINDEQTGRIAREERAKIKFEAHKAKIRQELSGFNQQLAGDPELQKSLAVILPKKHGYNTFYDKGRSHFCTGLPISRASSQMAVMTTAGIKFLHEGVERRQGWYEDGYTSYTEVVFKPVDPAQADVEELFPKAKFPVDKLPDAILNAVLQSPNKK